MNCSRPIRRSSMKDSSKRPSSERNGNCLFRALPGRDGTTICRCKGSTQVMATIKIMKSNIHTSCAVKPKLQTFLYIHLNSHFHLLLTQRTNLQCNSTVYFKWSSTSSFYRSKCNTNIVVHQIILIISLYPPAGLNYDPEPCHYGALTLLSLSSSFFNHSKSLYLLLTQESFSLKMGRFVCTNKGGKKTHNISTDLIYIQSLWVRVGYYHDLQMCLQRQSCDKTHLLLHYFD